MQRDINLIREILLWATNQDSAGFYQNPTIDGYAENQIGYHVYLMSQAGLVEAADTTTNDSDGPEAILLNLTWAGHDFVDAAKDSTVWSKAKSQVLSSGASFTFDILKDVLAMVARGSLGL